MPNKRPSKCSRIESKGIDHDPRAHKQIYEFPVNEQDETYLIAGPYQPRDIKYPYKTYSSCVDPSNFYNNYKTSFLSYEVVKNKTS